tara:strand:+ start:400 stop:1107 length:708 start_codon:yes stop_codon:yes gene_type:complete
MDSAALDSLTPLLDGIDQWVELLPLLPVIISLELILSADNAVALASITRSLKNKKLQNTALNIGIFISLIFRLLLIIFSQYLLKLNFISYLCGFYLIFLSIKNIFYPQINENNSNNDQLNNSLFNVIVLISITDLAFSIDSITAAVSISDQLLLVITGAIIGVIALRFTSSLFIKWLDIYIRLEKAGYLAIGFIGIKLIIQLLVPSFLFPDYIVFFVMSALLIWGFSLRKGNQSK